MMSIALAVLAVAAVAAVVVISLRLVLQRRRFAVSHPEIVAAIALAKGAAKSHRVALKAYNQGVKHATNELAALESPTGRVLGSCGGVTLYERSIATPQGTGSLIGVKANAADESSVRQRLTATRMLTLGVFSLAAPKKSGTGNAYIVIEGPGVSGVATLAARDKANAGPEAFSFAAKINNAARAAELAEGARPAAIAAARQRLRVAEDRSDLVVAENQHTDAVAALALQREKTGPNTTHR